MCYHVACLWWGDLFRCCHLAPFLLLCISHTLPSGTGADVASDVAQYDLATCLWMVWRGWMVACRGVDHWLTTTWHCGGAHLSGGLCQGGAHLLTWTNERVSRGTQLLSWPNQGLPCGIVTVTGFLNWHSFLSPSYCNPWLSLIILIWLISKKYKG
jgi:hypothetical protein